MAIDFEEDAPGSTYGIVGSEGTTATVLAASSISGLPLNGSSTNVLRVTVGGWGSGPKFNVALPAGKTLADYVLKVDVYLPVNTLGLTNEYRNYYKDLIFMAGNTITGALSSSSDFYQSKIGTEWNHADVWTTFTLAPDAVKGAALTGEFEISLGIYRDPGADADAYYFDNIRLELLP